MEETTKNIKKSTIIHVPHASTAIPKEYEGTFYPGRIGSEREVMTDWFCDELFGCGREMIIFPISRLVCDVERFRNDEEEVMAKIGMGLAYTSASDLGKLRKVTPDEREEIAVKYYDPHHEAFTKAVGNRLAENGKCLIIDGHSFYRTALPYELCRDEKRPDFCIGTSEFHTPHKLTEALAKYLEKSGYSVKIDSPFAGTIVPMKYYEKDSRVKSVMIEVNRRLYMDKPGVKNENFQKIREIIAKCVEIAEKRSFFA